jgi:hypothetical protein
MSKLLGSVRSSICPIEEAGFRAVCCQQRRIPTCLAAVYNDRKVLDSRPRTKCTQPMYNDLSVLYMYDRGGTLNEYVRVWGWEAGGHKFMLVPSSVASRFVVFTEGTHMCTECSDFISKKVLAIYSTFHATRFYTFYVRSR